MNRILTVGMAAIAATFLAQPVYGHGDDRRGGGGGGGGAKVSGGGGGGGRVSAPRVSAPQFSAPAMHANVMRAPSAPRVATQPRTFVNPSAPRMATTQPRTFVNPSAPMVRPNTTFTPSMARTQRSFQQRNNAPSVAFGGTAINNNNPRSFATTSPSTQFANRGGNGRGMRAPGDVSRSWDRGREHEWNHHHYRWSGGDWVIIDPGLPYDYSYGYGDGSYYDEPAPYSTAYSYDYASSEPLAISVQDRLTRLGYSPGPIDGVIGAQTRDALADFQDDNRLPVTGQIDTGTLRALGLR